MTKRSAGILVFRKTEDNFDFFLVHPGGPFWAKKDLGSWSIPKGEYEDEDTLTAARREFKEETSINIDHIPEKKFVSLSPQTLKSGKTIAAFGLELDIDPSKIKSNSFKLGNSEYPEIDRGQWFDKETALQKINPEQVGFITQLENYLKNH